MRETPTLAPSDTTEAAALPLTSLPTVSILLPFLNEERNLRRCLESVAVQDYPSDRLEIVAADAGSVDRSREIMSSFDSRLRIRVVDNSARKGTEWGKALALGEARGDLIQCMDADMWFTTRSMLRTLVAPFQRDSDIAGAVAPFAFLSGLPVWSRYLSLDELQRDPLLAVLTPDIEDFVVRRCDGYSICRFPTTRIPPIGGTTMFRRDQIDVSRWGGHFRDVDHAAYLVGDGYSRFAYVDGVAWGHLHCRTLGELIRKRRRNVSWLDTGFLSDVVRDFVWIDLGDTRERRRLVMWAIGTNLVLPRLFEGVRQALERRRWEALLRPVVALAVVDALLIDMVRSPRGRGFLYRAIAGGDGRRVS